MRALSIRQPFVELILRGLKTAEVRTRPTRVIGERFWIYACKGSGVGVQGSEKGKTGVWSLDLAMPGGGPPEMMLGLAEELMGLELPRGLIVGSAVISHCTPVAGAAAWRWHLADVQRIARPRKPARHPQPVWFRPF